MMDLDEAIQHCKEQVQEQAKKGCYSCAEEHQQLAEWLKELKAYKYNESNGGLVEALMHSDAENERLHDELKAYRNKSEIPTSCEDLISRQAVLDAMYELCNTGETLKENPWRDNPHIDAITDAIDDLPSVTPQQRTGRWIPVSERVPEDGEEVLCFLESEEMAVLFRRNNWGQYEWVDGGFATGSYDVIAWMPLPQPYKAESEVQE